MNRYRSPWLLIALCLIALSASCTRNGMPKKQSTSRSKVDHLIIKEVFYSGHYWRREFKGYNFPARNQMVSDDQYIIIYNPTNEVKYLDGLALCIHAIDPTISITFAPGDNFVNRYYGISSISYFPGSGHDHPIQPKQSITIAQYAIDYKEDFIRSIREAAKEEGEAEPDLTEYKGLDALLDLSKADFEWSNIKYGGATKNNPNVPDLEPILVEPDTKGRQTPYFELKYLQQANGIALVRLPWSLEDFKNNYQETKQKKGYRHYINVTSSAFADFYAIEIPFANVIDCMTVCPKRRFQMRPSKLDKGYNAVTDVPFSELRHSDYPKFSGLALTRKWDGRKFVDDDNSTTDFEVKAASLSRKDANGNTIK